MTNLVIGNIVATISAIFMIYAGILKDKKKIIYVQTIQIALLVVSNFVLGGFLGGIVNILCVIRNILSYNDKLDFKAKMILTVLSIVFSVPSNNLGILGLLPLISTVIYIWLMNIKDVIKFKYLIIFTNFTWLVYDILILSVVTAVFDFVCICTNFISILRIGKDKEQNKENNKDENQGIA